MAFEWFTAMCAECGVTIHHNSKQNNKTPYISFSRNVLFDIAMCLAQIVANESKTFSFFPCLLNFGFPFVSRLIKFCHFLFGVASNVSDTVNWIHWEIASPIYCTLNKKKSTTEPTIQWQNNKKKHQQQSQKENQISTVINMRTTNVNDKNNIIYGHV